MNALYDSHLCAMQALCEELLRAMQALFDLHRCTMHAPCEARLCAL